jgi:hypothetical protein
MEDEWKRRKRKKYRERKTEEKRDSTYQFDWKSFSRGNLIESA